MLLSSFMFFFFIVLFLSCMLCFCLGSCIYDKCVPCFLLFCDIAFMLMSNLHKTFFREYSLEKQRKFVPRVYHDQMAWPSVYSICLLFQSIRTVLAYTLIRLFFRNDKTESQSVKLTNLNGCWIFFPQTALAFEGFLLVL